MIKIENKLPLVSVVVPSYNQAEWLPKTLDSIIAQSYPVWEAVIVDDGSKDKTASLASSADAHVIRHVLNSGSGGATATGLSYAQQNGFDFAVTLDADGQHKASDAIKGVEVARKKHVDLLIGSRLINSEGMSKVNILGNKGLSHITYLFFGVSVTDSQSGMRVFSRQSLEKLKWKTNGYEFCSEMLWRAKQLGLQIDEYPIQAIYTDYSMSKGQNNWNAFNIIKSLLKRRIIEVFGE